MPPFIINPQQMLRRGLRLVNIDEAALIHDRKLHPAPGTVGGPTHYSNGMALWTAEAKEKLKDDFDNNRHLNKTRAEFKATRECYEGISEQRITQRLDYLKQNTKDFGKTPGQDKEEKHGSKKAKRPKQLQYKPENSRKGDKEAYVDGSAPPRKRKKKAPASNNKK